MTEGSTNDLDSVTSREAKEHTSPSMYRTLGNAEQEEQSTEKT